MRNNVKLISSAIVLSSFLYGCNSGSDSSDVDNSGKNDVVNVESDDQDIAVLYTDDDTYDHPSYGFNFVDYVDDTVENDGLFAWDVDTGVKLINQSGTTDSFMRLSSNSTSWTGATYTDFGYFKPNPSDFTMTMKLRIFDYLTSEANNSYLIVNIETGGPLLKVRFNQNGIQAYNSRGGWSSLATSTSAAYENYAFKVRDGKLEEVLVNGSAQSFSTVTLPESDNYLLEVRALGRSTTEDFTADVDELLIYSLPKHLDLIEAVDKSINAQGTAEGTHFMHLGIGSDGLPVGLNANGGGYITQIYNQGDGDPIESSTNLGSYLDAKPQYGAGSNQSVRGQMHSSRYNPVQAGISAFVGHAAEITKLKAGGTVATTSTATKTMVIEQFPTYNDPTTEYAENLTYDFEIDGVSNSYSGSVIIDEINDGLAESAVSATEEGVTELDFTGYFKDVSTDEIPVMLSYGEWKYVRPPFHLLQLSRDTGAIDSSLTPLQISTDPERSSLKTSDTDLGSMRIMREVRANSDFGYTWVHWRENGVNKKAELTGTTKEKIAGTVSSYDFEVFDSSSSSNPKPDNNLVILATNGNLDKAGAVGLYYPNSSTNINGTVGYDREDHDLEYKEDRRTSVVIRADWVKDNWIRLRLHTFSRGLFRPSKVENVYESFRSENYTLFGTANEIYDKVDELVK